MPLICTIISTISPEPGSSYLLACFRIDRHSRFIFAFMLLSTLNSNVNSTLTSTDTLPSPRPCFCTHFQASGRQLVAFIPTKNGVSNTGGSKSGVFVPGAFSPKSRKELKQAVESCTASSSGSSTDLVDTNPPKRTVAYDRVLLPAAVCCVCE